MATRQTTATVPAVPLTPEDAADAAVARAATFSRDGCDHGVAVVDGIGVRIHVKSGALVVEDGMGEHHRTRRYDKVDGLRRLVLLSDYGGSFSLDAMRWLRRSGVSVLVLAPDGSPTFSSAGLGSDDARLRRAQVAANRTETGLEIIRRLLTAKLTGEAAIARDILGAPQVSDELLSWVDELDRIGSPEDARAIEAQAGQAYFGAWPARAVIRFVAKDASRVPPHWRRFEGRRSALRSGNRNMRAERPLNALLNYLFRLAEAESRVALLAVGLDPGLGLLHSDYPGRDALALDLVETARPAVERYVLQLVADHRFRKRDFVEGHDGHVRLLAPLTHTLAETMPTWAEAVAPHAEAIAHQLAEDVPGRIVKRTPLTGKRRRDAVARLRPTRSRPTSAPAPVSVCEGCGAPVARRGYLWCDACRPAAKREAALKARTAQDVARRRRRAAGMPEPAHSPEANKARGASIGRRDAEALAWDAAHPGVVIDRTEFGPIAVALAELTGPAIAKATGLSKSHADGIRRGRYVPHPRHWPALAELAGVPCPFKVDDSSGGLDLAWWREEVVPLLGSVPTTAISEATGLSSGQASKVRRGLNVPNPRHWPRLAELAGAEVRL